MLHCGCILSAKEASREKVRLIVVKKDTAGGRPPERTRKSVSFSLSLQTDRLLLFSSSLATAKRESFVTTHKKALI